MPTPIQLLRRFSQWKLLLGKLPEMGVFHYQRNGIAGETTDGGLFNVETTNEATALPPYQGKKLSDFYTSQGAVLVDAFLAANPAGGTPTARPEDLEVHPETKKSSSRTLMVRGKMDIPILESLWFPSTAVPSTPAFWELFKIIEDSSDGTGTTFRWQRFARWRSGSRT